MTAGSILYCNIITTLLRNKIAANRQRAAIENKETVINQGYSYPKGMSMNDFINHASFKHSSGSLRI